MATIIETDLKEVLGEIKQQLNRIQGDIADLKLNQARMEEKLTGQIAAVEEKLTGQITAVEEKLTGQIVAVEEKLTGKINVLDEKVTGFGKRLENQEFTNRGILIALIVALIAGAAKLFGFLPNP